MTGIVFLLSFLAGMTSQPPPEVRFRNVLDRAEAVEVLRDWWQDGPKARGLEKEGFVIGCTAYHVPFWSTTWEITVYVDVSLEDTFRRSPVKVVSTQSLASTDAACDAGTFEVSFLPDLRGEAVSQTRGLVRELDATVPESESLARQKTMIEKSVAGMIDEKHRNSPRHINARLRECTLISYPLWLVRYSYGDRTYQATIDGVTGEVLAGTAPGDLRTRCCTGVGVFLVCAVGATVWLWILRHLGWGGALMLGSWVFLFCLGIVGWKYSFLRYGSVIVSGQAEGGYRYDEGPPSPLRPAPP
ncbi:hypothetical protein [Methanofollis sp.]|uniref:hypothetical protein n=1 Tax=Methanofollis sp. TaxID=2052835 RepID=UPI00260ECF0A|nr:hypothetical protein [Methanofollis sp.]